MDQEAPLHHGDAASVTKHFAEFFPQIAAFDANKDGKLDETEQAALKRAIEKGEFAPHGPHPHEGENHQ